MCENSVIELLNHRHGHSEARRRRPPRRASNGVTEESMQLSANAEILRPRQIARGKPVRTDLAGLRMTMFVRSIEFGVLTHALLPRRAEAHTGRGRQ